jgi:poly(3-hydroxyalkanoate) synthetase
MASVFQLMTPVRSMTKYNIDLLDVVEDDKKLMNFLRMEKGLADRPHHPGAAAKQWLIELYKENRLVKGTFELDGEAVVGKTVQATLAAVTGGGGEHQGQVAGVAGGKEASLERDEKLLGRAYADEARDADGVAVTNDRDRIVWADNLAQHLTAAR